MQSFCSRQSFCIYLDHLLLLTVHSQKESFVLHLAQTETYDRAVSRSNHCNVTNSTKQAAELTAISPLDVQSISLTFSIKLIDFPDHIRYSVSVSGQFNSVRRSGTKPVELLNWHRFLLLDFNGAQIINYKWNVFTLSHFPDAQKLFVEIQLILLVLLVFSNGDVRSKGATFMHLIHVIEICSF